MIRLWKLVAARPWKQMMRRYRDVLATLAKHVFQIKLTNTLNLLWQVIQDLIANGSSDKFSEQYIGKTII